MRNLFTRLFRLRPEDTIKEGLWSASFMEQSKTFDVVFNIRNASVTPTIGIIALELEGEREVIKKAVAWFEANGVQVEPVEINTIEG